MSEQARFVAPARVIALLTAVSRVLGVLREILYAYFFGAAAEFSAYRIAFMVPNLARRLFGEGAMSSAFIPVLAEKLETDGPAAAKRLCGSALTLLAAVLLGLTLLAELGLGLAQWIHPSVAILLTLIMMPYMIFICLTAFAGAMLNVVERFAAPAAAPIVLNLVLIAAIFTGGVGGDAQHLTLLVIISIAVVLAGVLQLWMQLFSLRRAGFWPEYNFDWKHPALRRVMYTMVPMLVGLSAVQINVLADKVIAYFFVPEGRGPGILGYADMLQHLPQGVFGVALATAIFPLLSGQAARGDRAGLARAVESGLRLNTFIALPASVGLIVLARPIVSLVYERGKFGPAETAHVATALVCYSVGMVAYCAQPILARAFYALQDMRTPVYIAAYMVVLNLGLSLGLVFRFAEGGIAVASSVSAIGQMVLLTQALRKLVPELQWRTPILAGLRTGAAAAAMGAFLWAMERWDVLPTFGRLIHLLVAIPCGVAVFALAASLLRCPELPEVLARRRGLPPAAVG